MKTTVGSVLVVVSCVFGFGCGASDTNPSSSTAGTLATAGTMATAGTLATAGATATAGTMATAGTLATAGAMATAGTTAGTDANAGTSADAGTMTTDDASTSGETSIDGTLGALGATKPIVTTLVIENSGEKLIYMSTVAITCDQLKTSRWLGSIAAGAQVVEVVVKSDKAVPGTVNVGFLGGEVNYAEGGKSSSYEKGADSGSITFTSCMAMGDCDGTFNATYTNPSAMIMGNFHATFCDGGQGY